MLSGSLVAYSVASRTREIGIRVALGATPGNAVRYVMVDAGIATLTGVAIGIGMSLAMMRSLSSILYGARPVEISTLASGAAVLLLVGSAASYFLAQRAARLNPVDALRSD